MTNISISGIDSSGNLVMDNNGNATVPKKSQVQWVVTTTDIASIAISLPPNPEPDIWDVKPAPVGGSKNWRGQVKDIVGGEDYYISYTTPDGGEFKHDPRIQVN